MDSMKERKYKDAYPLNTINKIRNILNEMGILTIENTWTHSADHFFSVTISVINSTLSTNGKGTTYEYALASAYGELMERLQNQAPFHLNTDVSKDAITYKNFFYAPDEKQLSDHDLLNNQNEWVNEKLSNLDETIDKQTLLTKWKQISYEDIPCDFIGIPFYNMNQKTTSYIPIKMLSKMYMSNGMCAGNTAEEALVQGISEILERNVNKRVINEKLTPPTIPKEFIKKYPKINDMIIQIESSGNFEVILKDCSFEEGFPVIGILFIDKDTQTYFIKFGSHPIFELAVERTLTELLQGQDVRQMKGTWEFSYKSSIKDSHNNMINILVNGYGEYPVEFFRSKESYEFKPPIDTNKMNNKELLNYLTQLIQKSGHDVLVRDVSFLGFPSFHVIVPNLSEVEEIDDIKQLDNYAQFLKIKKSVRSLQSLNNEELIELSNLIEEHNIGFETSIMQYLNIPTCKNFPWYYTNFGLLSTAIYCKTNNYAYALGKIETLLISLKSNSSNVQMITYYKCLRDYLAGKTYNQTNQEIKKELSTFYQSKMISGIIHEIGNPDTIFKNYPLISCFHCSNCNLITSCPHLETERVYKLLKEKYAISNLHNESLLNVFHP